MCHDGSIWREDSGLTGCYQSLEVLPFEKVAENYTAPAQSVLNGPFANVTALHVESTVIYGAEEMKLMQALLRRPCLQYLRCSHRLYGQDGNYRGGYPHHREDCRRSFGLGERAVALAKLPRRYPLLEELSFEKLAVSNILPRQSVMNTSFFHLITLRVESDSMYGAQVKEKIRELLISNPRLQYLSCSYNNGYQRDNDSAYIIRRFAIRNIIGLGDKFNRMARANVPLACKLAF